jgi:hypothetical protein
MSLTTSTIVKARLGLTGTENDTVIAAIVTAVSTWIANHCQRGFEREASKVVYPQGGTDRLQLHLYPIESISEIVQDWDRDFASATPLVADEDYILDESNGDEVNTGVIYHATGLWYDGPKRVRVTYTGGYWPPDGVGTMPTTARVLPGPVAEAAALMACHVFANRAKFGSRNISVGDMSVSEVTDGLLKIAGQLLEGYVCWA